MKPNELSKMGRADYVSPSTNVVKIVINQRFLVGSASNAMMLGEMEVNPIIGDTTF